MSSDEEKLLIEITKKDYERLVAAIEQIRKSRETARIHYQRRKASNHKRNKKKRDPDPLPIMTIVS